MCNVFNKQVNMSGEKKLLTDVTETSSQFQVS